MRFRKLRIAWSVFWGLACVLMVVLWVRSYWIVDMIQKGSGSTTMHISVDPGTLGVFISDDIDVPWWTRVTMQTEKYLAAIDVTHSAPPSRVWGYSGYRANGLALPFWFLILIGTTLGAAPWLGWRRYSLRSLLIATSLVAVVLGLVVYQSR